MLPIAARLFGMLPNKPRTLTGAWIESCMAAGLSKAEALRQLNQALGTNYRSNRLYEWIDGVYSPERPVRLYMLKQALPRILGAGGLDVSELTPDQVEQLAERLT